MARRSYRRDSHNDRGHLCVTAPHILRLTIVFEPRSQLVFSIQHNVKQLVKHAAIKCAIRYMHVQEESRLVSIAKSRFGEV